MADIRVVIEQRAPEVRPVGRWTASGALIADGAESPFEFTLFAGVEGIELDPSTVDDIAREVVARLLASLATS